MKPGFLLIPVLLILLPVAASGAQQPDPALEQKYREAAGQLTCRCGCNEQLTLCAMQNCHSATPMRAEIRQKLQAGAGVEEIVESFVARMGKVVLAAPTLKGFDLAAWVTPFVSLVMGLVLVSWIVYRMSRRPAAAVPQNSGLDPRVEKELRDFEEES